MIEELAISTKGKNAFIDVTSEVEKAVTGLRVKSGVCIIFVPHTTAALTINENADSSVRSDIINALKNVVPDSGGYLHAEGNSPAHVKASLFGNSLTIPVENGSLRLGTWQGIYLCEFDGPRTRKIIIKVLNG
ncbi:MAG: YjbQ family protein [Candidatus Omnitrophica bacterium]|nr:YjbQ family protein [Candidatus Omnitrophota bacterium]